MEVIKNHFIIQIPHVFINNYQYLILPISSVYLPVPHGYNYDLPK